MKIKELKQKGIDDLHKLLNSSREELRSLRFSISSEQEKNVRKLRDIKKTIAKILTVLNLIKKEEKARDNVSSDLNNKNDKNSKKDEPLNNESPDHDLEIKKDQVKLDK